MAKGEYQDFKGIERRSFLKKALATAISMVLGLTSFGIGLTVLLDPLRRKTHTIGWVQITWLEAVPADGIPRYFQVKADRVDAWNKSRLVPVGAVYLRRVDLKLQALNVVCPHAGGFVDYVADHNCFLCPLHNSRFTVDGRISDPASPAARSLDSLEVEVRRGREVWVRFQNFQAGKAQKIPV